MVFLRCTDHLSIKEAKIQLIAVLQIKLKGKWKKVRVCTIFVTCFIRHALDIGFNLLEKIYRVVDIHGNNHTNLNTIQTNGCSSEGKTLCLCENFDTNVAVRCAE